MEEIIARKYQVLKSEWNERQRRLWAASEAMCLGYGGVSIVARATGLSRPIIMRGIKELENEDRLSEGRVRREGAGRKKATEKQPDLLSSLDALVEPTAKGDPMSPLRWTTKSTRRLCDALNEQGFEISFMQVGRLLHELEYQLSANRKSIEGGTDPDRNTQFEFINEQVQLFQKKKCPVISVGSGRPLHLNGLPQQGQMRSSSGTSITFSTRSRCFGNSVRPPPPLFLRFLRPSFESAFSDVSGDAKSFFDSSFDFSFDCFSDFLPKIISRSCSMVTFSFDTSATS